MSCRCQCHRSSLMPPDVEGCCKYIVHGPVILSWGHGIPALICGKTPVKGSHYCTEHLNAKPKLFNRYGLERVPLPPNASLWTRFKHFLKEL